MTILPLLTNDQNTLEYKMTKIPFLSQTLIPNKIYTKTINHTQAHINTHNK